MKIAIDFDGTCVEHAYPEIGADIGAVPVLKRLVAAGHQLILFTMRSGEKLNEASRWFEENGIPLYGIQSDPEQATWTSSPKCFANLYIDDAALGIPLKQDYWDARWPDNPIPKPLEEIDMECDFFLGLDGRPYVDWEKVEGILKSKNILPTEEQ